MFKNFLRLYAIIIKPTSVPKEYKDELQRELLRINIHRDRFLSLILIIINLALLYLDSITSICWTRDTHVFGKFSYYHILLLLIPFAFLLLVYGKNEIIEARRPFYTALHACLNTSVLVLCALIAVSNELANKDAYTYIIALFCIGSTVLLTCSERFFVFFSSYLCYFIGIVTVQKDFYHVIRDLFFSALLVLLALMVSYINYSSHINNFVSNKVILEKNQELDRIYKMTREDLEIRSKELAEAMEYEKLRVAFFANISHELRTPLSVIYSTEQMLDHTFQRLQIHEKHKEISQYLHIIKQNCHRLIRLIANLIDITKIDAGYFQVTFQNCDIVKTVEDITLSVAKFIESRDVTLTFDTEVEELTVACDPEKIERILLNLLSNAVKFTPKGGCIYVNIYEREDWIHISVKDTGIGIPAEMKNSIFERFIQVDKSSSRTREGSGIGLSLVKSLVELHQGKIHLLSEPGEGSEFIIEIPKRILSESEIVVEHHGADENHHIEKIHVEFSDIYQ